MCVLVHLSTTNPPRKLVPAAADQAWISMYGMCLFMPLFFIFHLLAKCEYSSKDARLRIKGTKSCFFAFLTRLKINDTLVQCSRVACPLA